MEDVIGFIVAGLALTGSPGPNTLSLAATGAAFGARRGVGYLAGLTLGMVGVMAITASGVMGLLFAVPGATPVITAVVAAYFLYLAWRIATAPPLSDDAGERRQPSVLAGMFVSLVNPKAYAAMAALFSGFTLLRGALVADALVKVAALTAIILVVNIFWLFTGAALTRLFRDPKANRIVNITFAVLLIASLALAVLV